jgi:HPt (histidine-containing phosphotransfer) domain-containing protein
LSFADKPRPEIPHHSSSPFNFSEALSNIGGDENLLAELASIFLEEYPEILANVRTAVGNNDGEALIYYAHALKGSVSNFVAGDTESAARKLEQIGREGDIADAPKVLSELETALSRLTPALSDLAVQGAA